MHRFTVGQEVTSKSGALYRVTRLRHDTTHRKLAGDLGYEVRSLRNGQPFGPERLMRECALSAAPLRADFTPGEADGAPLSPPAMTCIEHAYGTTTRLSFQIKVF